MPNELAVIKNYMRSDVVKSGFSEILGERGASAYIASVVIAVSNSEQLQRCTPKSIAVSAMRAAALRLSVDPSLGKAYLMPFKDMATLVVGYKGLIELATRTGKYRYINVGPVYEGETVEEDRISGLHKLSGHRKGDKIIGYIAAFEMLNGYAKTLYMTLEEIHAHARKYSKSYDNPNSLWKKNPEVMERKTPLRILLQTWGYLDQTDALVAMQSDEDDAIDAMAVDLPDVVEAEPESKPLRTEAEILQELGFGNGTNGNGTNGNRSRESRPYPPAVLKERLESIRAEAIAKGWTVKENAAQVVAMNLEECFAGLDDAKYRRHALTHYLTGHVSTKDLDAGWLYALKKWLNPQQDSGGAWSPDPMAVREAQAAYTEAERAKGQMELALEEK
jgi:recombination protein RecT